MFILMLRQLVSQLITNDTKILDPSNLFFISLHQYLTKTIWSQHVYSVLSINHSWVENQISVCSFVHVIIE